MLSFLVCLSSSQRLRRARFSLVYQYHNPHLHYCQNTFLCCGLFIHISNIVISAHIAMYSPTTSSSDPARSMLHLLSPTIHLLTIIFFQPSKEVTNHKRTATDSTTVPSVILTPPLDKKLNLSTWRLSDPRIQSHVDYIATGIFQMFPVFCPQE